MPILQSNIDVRGEDFQRNSAALSAQVADLRAKISDIAQGGDESARTKHTSRGKLLPRARVEALLDPGSPFLEFSQLAAHKVYKDNIPAAGLITGIGRVSG
ncbi:MAG TPA: carboxyl transferase domain-containing protein, partial [Dongiaceae bacterium]